VTSAQLPLRRSPTAPERRASAVRKLLVTGAGGRLGSQVCALAPAEWSVTPLTRVEVDLTDTRGTVAAIEQAEPTVVIHCAAWTGVDAAEGDPQSAMQANGLGTWNVAVACARAGARLLHVSTDFVFDGLKGAPYREDDLTGPLSAYGRSKLAGEVNVRTLLADYLIVRTQWLFGPGQSGFAQTMLRLAGERDEVPVVADQFGCPSYTPDVAVALLSLAAGSLRGVCHAANSGVCSWFDLAWVLLEAAGQDPGKLRRISRTEWQARAPRPASSALDTARLATEGPGPLRPWWEAAGEFARQLTR